VRVGLDAAQPVSWVLLTQEPLAINHVRRKLAEGGKEAVELRLRLASLLFAQTEQVDRQIAAAGQGWPPAAAWLSRSKASVDRAGRLLQSGDLENASRGAADAAQALYQVRRAHWERAARSFPSPLASPLTSTFASLAQHWQLASRLAAARWQPNALSGGDFEDLDHMLASGWQQRRGDTPAVQTAVELSFQAPRAGRSSLHLQAWTQREAGSLHLEDWPITVVSAPRPLLAGQLVRIHGWVNVPEKIRDTPDGLLIIDSLGGLPLAERIEQTTGWREFTLYRVATRGEELTVTFALTGLGEVWLDDVTVSPIE
jgi:hypothetical protein